MSPYLIRALLENSIMADVEPGTAHAESKARTIDGIMEGLLASAECLGRLGSAVEAVASRTTLPSLDAAIEAARLADEGKSFAAMAGDLKHMADQAALSTAGIMQQCQLALDMAQQAASALEDVAGPAGALLFQDDPEAIKPEPPLDMERLRPQANVIPFPGR